MCENVDEDAQRIVQAKQRSVTKANQEHFVLRWAKKTKHFKFPTLAYLHIS